MRGSRFFTPFFITVGIMALFALIFAVSVDVYDALFWARFCFSLVGIALASFSIMRAAKQTGLPLILHAACTAALYVVGCFSVLAFIPYAALVTILCLVLNLCFVAYLFLDKGIKA
ncbi:MAG: hypothetical protein J6L88_01020 [Clostridia bacterium]|nr:hypothetical protein [Clostridia bacterium]